MDESPVNIFALGFSVSAREKGQKLGGKKSYAQILHPSCSRAMYDLGHTIMPPSLYLKKNLG